MWSFIFTCTLQLLCMMLGHRASLSMTTTMVMMMTMMMMINLVLFVVYFLNVDHRPMF